MLTGCLIHTQLFAETGEKRTWEASWITVPGTEANDYGVYYFRKHIKLEEVPETFPVRVSGDNRYKLYVNGELVSLGPARGDVSHWRYETVDLASSLHTGNNVVAALVWNDGDRYRPAANMSLRTGFILQGETEASSVLNSNDTWKCTEDTGYLPIPVVIQAFHVAGPGERVDMRETISDWYTENCDDSLWPSASPMVRGMSLNTVEIPGREYGGISGWELMPSTLPPMELTQQRLQSVRSAIGCEIPAAFPKEKRSFTIPAHTKASVILDQSVLTNAYFTLEFSKGKDSGISLGYQEAFYTNYPSKGNRNEVEGKYFVGLKDSLISNGKDGQSYTTHSWRTYRYVQLDIQTKEEPLVIDDLYGTFTGFPFELKASLRTDDEEMEKIFETGWRTARLCAVDTYMDCPYYERLQYVGDTRIQALISLYNSGDDRLVRNFLDLIDTSRRPEGITMSRYPDWQKQLITPFSLWYIASLHDYLMYANDADFVRHKLLGMRQVLSYFAEFQEADGSLKDLPGWNFTDWVDLPGWKAGVAEVGGDGHSALMDLQLLLAYQTAAHIEQVVGLKELAAAYTHSAEQLKTTIQQRYWDETHGLYANRSERDHFSQHANALAILTEVVTGDVATDIANKLLTDESLDPASVYFKYYLNQALIKAGLGDGYMDWIDLWRENLAMGLTTWAEEPGLDTSRSDCHAWGASPNIEFFRTVLGIDSDVPCFQKVRIEPHLGTIQKIGGDMPHPQGMISVDYERTAKDGLKATITLPENITGYLVWKGKSYALQGGKNSLDI